MKTKVCLPPIYVINRKSLGNPIFQLRSPEYLDEVEVTFAKLRRSRIKVIQKEHGNKIVVLRAKKPVIGKYDILISPQAEIPTTEERLNVLKNRMTWLRPKTNDLDFTNLQSIENHCQNIVKTWKDQFTFAEEERDDNNVTKLGLRSAQIGALHAVLGYWKTSNKPATVVMPTGTGKTETMLALLVNQRIERLLVVVPTDSLRTQLAEKFISLGLLKQLGVVSSSTEYPVVGVLEHGLNDIGEIEQFFKSCNVIVTTMRVLNRLDDNLQNKISELCSHLFIDEAHHITAPTWEKFRRHFVKKTILQFTATPFRNDGKHVDGKIIFNFPLKKAQEEGYFKPINFIPLREYNPHKYDETIAKSAIKQLDDDLKKGLDHLVMARVDTIDRAKDVFEIYKQLAGNHNPVIIHSRQTTSERNAGKRKLQEKQSRIVVCVDMFGEGFDLPELKIAALHDVHKSLAVTIQFTGRFTRTKEKIGDATIIANVANAKVMEAIRELYAEDADWNSILRNLSEGATGTQEERSEFLDSFAELPTEIPIQNIIPKMSTVVYRTPSGGWHPENIGKVIKESTIFSGPTVNNKHNIAFFVTSIKEPVDWVNMKDIYNTIWDLYLIHWNKDQKLLYINSTHKSYHEPLAQTIAGNDVELIRGEQVFRTLHGINRLVLINLGLKSAFSRATRFTMHVGSDVGEGLSDAHVQNKIKSNLFGRGYENGLKASIGCSNKGRIWAYKVAHSFPEWTSWCEQIGKKLLDSTISFSQILENAIIPEPVTSRPQLVPLSIEWSEDALVRNEDIIQIDVAGEVSPFYEVGIDLVNHSKLGPIKFKVYSENKSVEYEVKIKQGKVEYLPTGQKSVYIKVGKKREALSDWLQSNPPTIRFEDGTFLVYNEIYKLKDINRAPLNKDKIQVWPWNGTDLSQESQGKNKNSQSIQFKVVKDILADGYEPKYDLVFDDDGSHEAADIVAMKVIDDRLIIHFYHCKFAIDGTTGTRVEDLYAVCGQAQKSVFWKGEVGKLISHLRKREITRLNKSETSRFERGDMMKLDEIENKASFLIPELKIYIVQPGLSKANVSQDQLTLLATTELYLQDTYSVPLSVVASQ